jgi:predicted RNase H-like HicB family nuclease
MELTARIHIEESSYWADVPELPGCFASGDTLDKLFESRKRALRSTSPMRASRAKADRCMSRRPR